MNILDYPLTGQAAAAVRQARLAAAEEGLDSIGTEHLLYGLLRTPCMASQILADHEIRQDNVQPKKNRKRKPAGDTSLPVNLTLRAKELMDNARGIALRGHWDSIGTEHILMALLEEPMSPGMRILREQGVDPMRLQADIMVSMGDDARELHPDAVEQGTPMLDQYACDLAAADNADPLIGREKEVLRVIRTLSRRTKNNPCLIGEPGVGKTKIVEGLAARIAEGNVPETLRGMRILSLDLAGMVAGSKYRGEFEEKIKRVIREASSDRSILLFLDEIHTLIGAGGAEGSLDAANILKPALSRGQIRLIGATTVTEYRKHIEKDAALERRFQPILVEEPSEQETEEILRGLKGRYEEHHHLTITDDALEAAVRLSSRYISDRFQPDKALDLLDESCARVFLRQEEGSVRAGQAEDSTREEEEALKRGDAQAARRIAGRRARKKESEDRLRGTGAVGCVTADDVAAVTADITGIPVRRVAREEGERLRSLEKELESRVVGQHDAVTAVARAVRRGRVGMKDPSRPIGSFLFLGPTGVGKTELSKALAEALFGREEALIRVDMSEYMEKHSVSKLIGSPPGYIGYEEGGQLSEKVRRNPYSVVLFDEIEKAHPDVFHILLQVLDDGHITDAQGRRVDFKNSILIMTSNAGAQKIINPKLLGFGRERDEKADYEKMKTGVMEEVRQIFRPEFLNRIDEILVFRSLNKEDMQDILTIMMGGIRKRVMEAYGIKLVLTPKAKTWLTDRGYSDKYGARPLKRLLQTELEDALTDRLLSGEICRQDTVTIGVKEERLSFTVRRRKEA